jgi:hypothetical protein
LGRLIICVGNSVGSAPAQSVAPTPIIEQAPYGAFGTAGAPPDRVGEGRGSFFSESEGGEFSSKKGGTKNRGEAFQLGRHQWDLKTQIPNTPMIDSKRSRLKLLETEWTRFNVVFPAGQRCASQWRSDSSWVNAAKYEVICKILPCTMLVSQKQGHY